MTNNSNVIVFKRSEFPSQRGNLLVLLRDTFSECIDLGIVVLERGDFLSQCSDFVVLLGVAFFERVNLDVGSGCLAHLAVCTGLEVGEETVQSFVMTRELLITGLFSVRRFVILQGLIKTGSEWVGWSCSRPRRLGDCSGTCDRQNRKKGKN